MSEGADVVPVDQGRRANESTGPLMDTDKGKLIGGDSFVDRTQNPEWLKTREEVYAKIKAARDQELSNKVPVDITVTMPDGKVLSTDKEGKNFQAWKTTPYDVVVTISQGLADASMVARVTYEKFVDDYNPAEDGMEGEDTLADAMEELKVDDNDKGGEGNLKPILWDLMRPLVGPVTMLELLKFDDDQDAKTVFWHSSAHMMGEALEHLYGVKLTIGPPLKGGFFYDSYMGKQSYRDDDCK
jgi:threonyl-tRNA synthetase